MNKVGIIIMFLIILGYAFGVIIPNATANRITALKDELILVRTENLELLHTNYQLRYDCGEFSLWNMRGEQFELN